MEKWGKEGPFFIYAACVRESARCVWCVCVCVLAPFGVESASLAACLQFKQAG